MRASARLAALAALLAVPTFSHAEDRNLKPNYDYVVEVNGALEKGWQVMSPEQRNRIFLIAATGSNALLVSIAEKAVRPVDRSMILKHPDGTLDVLAGAVSATLPLPLTVKGATATFDFQGTTIELKPRPPLLGPHTVEELVLDRPAFGEGIKNYQPESSAVSFLKEYSKPTEIEVYFGSWCSVCEAWVPKFLKSVQMCGNSRIQVHLFGVSRDFSNDQTIARQKGVRGLPTFIIRQEGIEVGRIVGAPPAGTLEAAIAEVLRAKSSSLTPAEESSEHVLLAGCHRMISEAATGLAASTLGATTTLGSR